MGIQMLRFTEITDRTHPEETCDSAIRAEEVHFLRTKKINGVMMTTIITTSSIMGEIMHYAAEDVDTLVHRLAEDGNDVAHEQNRMQLLREHFDAMEQKIDERSNRTT